MFPGQKSHFPASVDMIGLFILKNAAECRI